MDEKIKCLLCDSNKLQKTERILTKNIISLWKKRNIDTSGLFKNTEELTKVLCRNCGIIFFTPLMPGGNDFYSSLGMREWYYLHEDKTEFEYSNSYIKEFDSVLDIGSGRGAFTKYIDKKVDYVGLELSSKAVTYAQKENINVIEETIENHSINNKNKYDVVVSFQVLEHITNINSFVSASIDTIKPNGLFIIAVPNNDSFIKNIQNNSLNLPPHHLLHWNKKSLTFLANKYNLEILDTYKEKTTNVHKELYYSTMLSKFIRDIFLKKTTSVNLNFFDRLIHISALLLTKVIKFTDIHKNKDGHTIAIVMRKI
jgi:2-polyprenyl-3-methyl-5-hydroxy-6-metoxy-1,4-benzoquinol methylase